MPKLTNIGALTLKIGFWGPLYYSYSIRNPQNSIGHDLGPYIQTPQPPLQAGLGPTFGFGLSLRLGSCLSECESQNHKSNVLM